MKLTKEQMEALGRKIEALESEISVFVERAAKNLEALSEDESKKVKEHAGLVEVLRAARKLQGEGSDPLKPEAPAQQIQERAASAESGQPKVEVVPNPKDEKPFESIGEQLRAVAQACRGDYRDPRLDKVHKIHEAQRAASGMGEAIPSDGGFLLQKDFSNQLQAGLYGASKLLPLTTQLQLSSSSNGIEVLVLDETSRATGSRLGGVQVYWGNEADTTTTSKPKMRTVKMELLKMMAAVQATEELLQDSVALGQFLSSAFMDEFGFVIDDMILNGNGAGRPAGILGAGNGCLVTVSKETSQTADTFNFQNALKMRSRLSARSRKNARWLINQELETQLPQFTLLGGASSPGIYIPGGSVVDGIPMDRLMGYPVQVMEQCAGIGDLGDVIFADLGQYLTINKGGLQQASSIHVRFLQGEMTYRFTQRWNGTPLNNSALTPYKGSATTSPFVTLEAR